MDEILTGKYGLPLEVKFCKRCTRNNQQPASTQEYKQKPGDKKKVVGINEDGLCQACRFQEMKHKVIDWSAREKELQELCDKHRRNDGRFDVVVPGSGGKDSLYVAYELKHKYGMHPILATWPPNIETVQGKRNFQAWLDMGFANYTCHQNRKVHRILTRLAFENLCHPFQPFIIGQKNLAPKLAKMMDIDLVMYGEHDVEFGVNMDRVNDPSMDVSWFTSSIGLDEIVLGGAPLTQIMEDYDLDMADLSAYLPMNADEFKKSAIDFHFFGYYHKWNFQDMYYYSVENSNFLPADHRLQGGYDKYATMDDKIDWLHHYTYLIKFGMGRATNASYQEIWSGVITRDEGIALIKRFDNEVPTEYLQDCLDYMQITEKRFWEVIEEFRTPHLWKQVNGKWKLAHPIWEDGQ